MMPKQAASRPRRVLLVLLACLGLAVTGLVANAANAASPAPVRVQIDGISSSIAAPSGTPSGSVPYVLVKAGDSFFVDVSFWDASGAPASFNTNTTLQISSSTGTLTPTTGIAPKGATSARLTTSLSAAANQVALTVSVAPGPGSKDVAPGTSSAGQLFDVVSQLRFEDSTTNFAQGIGGESNCASATRQAPVCGVVLLPLGASSQVLLSLGVCDSAYAGCGSPKGSVVQTLADLSGLGYSKTNPATIVMKCDKSLCGGGSIQDQHLSFTFSGNGALGTAPPCPAKATIGPDQEACVDYVQSKRDGAGDSHLYLLVPRDVRISVG